MYVKEAYLMMFPSHTLQFLVILCNDYQHDISFNNAACTAFITIIIRFAH